MIAKLTLNSSQIKYYAQSALSGFETLCTEDAIECAKCNLQDLLYYIEGVDNGNNTVSILLTSDGKPRIIIEGIVSDSKI